MASIPIIGGVMELLGIAVTGWFVYRYGIVTEDRCGVLLYTFACPACG